MLRLLLSNIESFVLLLYTIACYIQIYVLQHTLNIHLQLTYHAQYHSVYQLHIHLAITIMYTMYLHQLTYD